MKVPGFATLGMPVNPGEMTNPQGDLSPYGATLPASNGTPETDGTDHVFGDVKTRYMPLIRVSNLITTRSDSFTVYAQVQAWQGVGTNYPNLVAQRRAAALLDRSQVRPIHDSTTGLATGVTPMGVTQVPNN